MAYNQVTDSRGRRKGWRFELGNEYAAKGRQFERTLVRVLHQENGARLRQAAEKLLDAAAAGQPWAIQFLAMKLDGPSVPQLDTVDTAFSITWSFAPAAIESQQPETLEDSKG